MKIAEFRDVLKDRTAAFPKRLEALKFIVHLVGDLHQPLHCADNNDRGGNGINLKFFGKNMNLHALRDSGIINKAGLDEEDFANELLENIDTAKIPTIQAGTVIEWTNASHLIGAGNPTIRSDRTRCRAPTTTT